MKNLTKLTALTLTAALALTACGSSAATAPAAESAAGSTAEAASGDLLSEIQAKGTITVAMEGTWAPWTYHDENDNLVGYDVEVATEIAKKLGVEMPICELVYALCYEDFDAAAACAAMMGRSLKAE